MQRVIGWLQIYEYRMFFWINRKFKHALLDFLLAKITHLGGAVFTLSLTIGLTLFGHGIWQEAGMQSLTALIISHIPVAILKKRYPRLRPYLVLPQTNICKNPLTDHSFPSGHTTAIFSVVLPFVYISPLLGAALFPLAILVGVSRIYLGLHYPTDCAVGASFGAVSAFSAVAFIG